MLRVAAYCRVSTDSDDQANSLESQKRYFSQYIERNPLWELCEVYVDHGVTGTSTRKRAAFNRMIADAQARRFDLIVTKEISRFARNTLDSILYTRKLRELGIGVIFLNDNINTLDPDAELRLTILSSIAQEESRKTSERVKWGQKRRMEQGVVFGRDMLGYDVRGGELVLNEAGARTVRLIFHKFARENKGSHVIARELREAGVPTATHMKRWSNTVILRILRNEKYCGDLVQKKTVTPSYLDHKKKYNRGEEELVALRDHHEPIVSRALFDAAQRELARRAPSEEQKARHSNRYCFSGKIKCGLCGGSYVSRAKKRRDGSVCQAWRCREAARHGGRKTDGAGNDIGCDNRSVGEEDLRLAVRRVVRDLPIDREAVARRLIGVVRSALRADAGEDRPERRKEQLERVEEKRRSLLELYLSKEISREDFRRLTAKYEAEAGALRQRREAEPRGGPAAPRDEPAPEVADIIRGLLSGEEWDDAFYRRVLDGIVARPGGVLEITLRLLPESRRCRIGGKAPP